MPFQSTDATNSKIEQNDAPAIFHTQALDLLTSRSPAASGASNADSYLPAISLYDSSRSSGDTGGKPGDSGPQITSSTKNADGTFSTVNLANGTQFQYQYAPDDGSGQDPSHRVDQITQLDSNGNTAFSWYKNGDHWSGNFQPGDYGTDSYTPGSDPATLGHIENLGISNVYVDANGLPQYQTQTQNQAQS